MAAPQTKGVQRENGRVHGDSGGGSAADRERSVAGESSALFSSIVRFFPLGPAGHGSSASAASDRACDVFVFRCFRRLLRFRGTVKRAETLELPGLRERCWAVGRAMTRLGEDEGFW